MKNVLFRGLTALSLGTALTGLSTSCTKDLDQAPKYELTPDRVYVDLASYKKVLGKVYGSFALTSLGGAGGTPDLTSIDGGTGDYIRQLWSAQELTTDEAVVAWNDTGIQDWHNQNWDANNPLIRGIYNRCYYEISLCNDFLRESTDEKLNSRLGSAEVTQAKLYRAEARFLRAVSFSHIIDLFGNGPFPTENDVVGTTPPPYYTRQQLYTFVESELLDLTTQLAPARSNEYGRVDQAAAHGYLARLYLNAGVYTGTPQYTKAAEQAQFVIASGYSLATTASSASSAYGRLFLADNNVGPATNEVIWPILFDVTRTQTYGGTTFLVNGSIDGASAGWQRYAGETTGWGGIRSTRALFDKFFLQGGDTTVDRRGRFWQVGQTLEISDLSQFKQGLGVTKFRNVNSDGTAQGASLNFSSVDFPMLRLADMMLVYAEAATRGNATRATALGYVNQIRRRAFGLPINTPSAAADITDAQMTTDFILDERARELHWEGMRRTDLIRYGKFTDATYLWPWKGGVANGRSVDAKYRLFPIPLSDITANPNMKQNPGY
ncbi:RagB/SusD family nutrient uptake outer membrane protein [Hymenobacter terricola]|uniref:RagB/SusD family nutrient uptake outer membrane protein n=1 Tax=Hymenobacter terricola TaxID=2819236 RepID=UPI001B3131C4|nr:RagB/SusD family nutrient uptake outer membrane protein [Hymenobacter terricola]